MTSDHNHWGHNHWDHNHWDHNHWDHNHLGTPEETMTANGG